MMQNCRNGTDSNFLRNFFAQASFCRGGGSCGEPTVADVTLPAQAPLERFWCQSQGSLSQLWGKPKVPSFLEPPLSTKSPPRLIENEFVFLGSWAFWASCTFSHSQRIRSGIFRHFQAKSGTFQAFSGAWFCMICHDFTWFCMVRLGLKNRKT